jgi:quercetin dioxygenase-like cupin family protein
MRAIVCLLIVALTSSCIYARDTNTIQAETLAKAGSSWDGAALPAYPEGEPEITILKFTIPPKTALPWHMHPFINAGVLLSGELTVETESAQQLHLKAGDSIVELVNTRHHGVNNGDVPAEIVIVYAGVKGMPVTVNKP